MTFDDLKKANELIKTTPIQGKDYAEVNQRIMAFRSIFPDGFIISEMVSNEGGVCIFKAECGFYREDGTKHVLGTGSAYEKEGSSFINRTSYIENCETSAIGRCLGTSGIGIGVSIASAEEVQNALLQQDEEKERGKANTKAKAAESKANDPKISHEKVEIAVATIRNKQTTLANILQAYNVEKLADLTETQYANMMGRLAKTPDKE